jgi:hypothetical protein
MFKPEQGGFEALVEGMISVARGGPAKGMTRSAVLKGIDSVSRALKRSYPNRTVFDALLISCPTSSHAHFKAWFSWLDKTYRLEKETLDRVLNIGISDYKRWAELARFLTEAYQIDFPFASDRPLGPEQITSVAVEAVEKENLRGNHKQALKNAYMLLHACFNRALKNDRDELYGLLSLASICLRESGVLANRTAIRRLIDLLDRVKDHYGDDQQIERLKIDCEAIQLSHFRKSDPANTTRALERFAREATIIRTTVFGEQSIKNWPLLWWGATGAAYNYINTVIDARVYRPLPKKMFYDDDYLIHRQRHKAEYPPKLKAVTDHPSGDELDAWHVRLLVKMLLHRESRSESIKVPHLDEACHLLDTILSFHVRKPFLSSVELRFLNDLQAEVMLCRFANRWTIDLRDEYGQAKEIALDGNGTAKWRFRRPGVWFGSISEKLIWA